MPPLYFDPSKPELVDIPAESLPHHPSSEVIIPLAELLVSKVFPYKQGDFPRTETAKWDEERVKHIGTLVTHELAHSDPPADFTISVAERLHTLGLFPAPINYFYRQKRFGGFGEFKRQVGASLHLQSHDKNRNSGYDTMSLDELSSHLLDNFNELLELPRGPRYHGPLTRSVLEIMNRAGLAPGHRYISKRFGSLSKFNEHLGYPDVSSWDEHDYIQYGAAILRHNGPDAITNDNLTVLATNKFGPHVTTITARFSWDEFKKQSAAELQSQLEHEAQHKEAVLTHYAQHQPELAKNEAVPFAEMAKHRALFLLSHSYLNSRSPELPARVNNATVNKVIDYIRSKVPGQSLADIETTAVVLDIFDDLWPTSFPRRLPILAKCRRK